MIERVTLLHGDCREVMRTLPAESVHCVVTSPPYWGLRDYGLPPVVWGGSPECEHEWGAEIVAKQSGGGWAAGGGSHEQKKNWDLGEKSQGNFCRHCGAWRGCLGLEPDPAQFIRHMVEVFAEVRRVLRKDGVCFMNLGDSYAGACGGKDAGLYADKRNPSATWQAAKRVPVGYKPKDLCLMPHRVAIALQEAGWWVRSTIVWSKANPMPESCRDRPTTAHEYVFLLTKAERYFWDADAVRENYAEKTLPQVGADYGGQGRKDYSGNGVQNPSDVKRRIIERMEERGGRNMRSVLHLPTEPCPEAHFATYPQKLVEPLIKAGTSEHGVCPSCGAPWRRIVDREFVAQPDVSAAKGARGHAEQKPMYDNAWAGVPRGSLATSTLGWEPTCACPPADPVSATVLDPFGGSGTTALVAAKLGRNAIHIDQSQDYLHIARRRLKSDEPGLGL